MFGIKVKILSSTETDQLGLTGLTGLEGEIFGVTAPGSHAYENEEIIGTPEHDQEVYSVYFKEKDVQYWMAVPLLEVVNEMSPVEMTIGNKQVKRDESGRWYEKDAAGNWVQSEQ